MKRKNILIVPSRYPSKYQRNNYIFVKEQAESLSEEMNVVVAGAIPVSLKFFFKKKFSIGRVLRNYDENFQTYFLYYPSIPKLLFFNELIRYLLNKILIKKILKSFKPNVVHFHSVWAGTIGKWIKLKYGIPHVITEHSSIFFSKIGFVNYYLSKKVFKNSNAVITVSESLRLAIYSKVNLNSIVIPNMVDTEFFKPIIKKENDSRNEFITIGNLVNVKNHDLLIKSFGEFIKEFPNSYLRIIGDGPNFQRLVDLIEILNLQNHISLIGQKNRNEVREFLNQADYFVLTSIKETFGVVVIEAISMGLPILCTNFGGISDELRGLPNCLVVDNNLKSIHQGLKEILHFKKSDKIREIALKYYSKERVLEKLNKVYGEI